MTQIPTKPLPGPIVCVVGAQTYALMLAGLTVVGFMARRRRQD